MAKRITEYISEHSNGRDVQVQLRQIVERYPYYQAARLMLLRSLFETHDPSFGQELRKAAIYIPSRRVLYNLIEADKLRPVREQKVHRMSDEAEESINRTTSLIDNFLTENPEDIATPKPKARITADAATDYVSYMMQIEEDAQQSGRKNTRENEDYGQPLLDSFLSHGKFAIQEHPDEELQKPQIDTEVNTENKVFTETLARIYIKQGKYDKALEIIRRLYLNYPKKNRYFADQIRFLEKLIVNNNNK